MTGYLLKRFGFVLRKSGPGALALFTVPTVVFAATPRTFAELIYFFANIINSVVPILFGIALIIFFWGIVRYIASAGDSDGHEKGRQLILWGIVALFVLVSLWGIVRLLNNTLLGGTSSSYPHDPVALEVAGATVES